MKRLIPPSRNSTKTLFIIAVGAAIMIAGHLIWWEIEDAAPPIDGAVSAPVVSAVDNQENIEEEAGLIGPPYVVMEADVEAPIDYEVREEELASLSLPDEPDLAPAPATIEPVEIIKGKEQAWKDNAALVLESAPSDTALAPAKITARVVIIIDDMGMSHGLSEKTIDLPAPLTLAFLPYAPNLKVMTKEARDKGHELMIHMPMEPLNPDLDVGTIALLDSMSEEELNAQMDKAFDSFDGYVGINNHMGSRLTQNERAMHIVMNALAKRGLLFVDSKTISTSVAAKTARQHDLDYAERDVFLDHQNTDEFVAGALAKLEAIAHKRGVAIAIGHPKAVTINGLRRWIPTLAAKGIQIVPVSAVVRHDRSAPIKVSDKAAQRAAPAAPALPVSHIGPVMPKANSGVKTLSPLPVQ